MARVVVEVMPKPEILDPQGKAVTGALARLGFEGMTVRQGKRFEIEVDGELDEARLAQVRDAAERLLANTVIEAFDVRADQTSATPVAHSADDSDDSADDSDDSAADSSADGSADGSADTGSSDAGSGERPGVPA